MIKNLILKVCKRVCRLRKFARRSFGREKGVAAVRAELLSLVSRDISRQRDTKLHFKFKNSGYASLAGDMVATRLL